MILKAMIKKEFLEMLRNYKLIIVPLVFMFLGAMQPITYYYLPDILKMATLPEGAIMQFPPPNPYETMYSVYGQFSQLGLFILVLISMGTVTNEVKSGAAENILVKPISYKNYILSKWIAYFSLTVLSILLGTLIGWFYTSQLIGATSIQIILKATIIYILFMLFFVALSLFLSSILNSSIAVGGITIAIAIGFAILANLPFTLWYLPSYLLKINQNILFNQSLEYLWLSLGFIIGYIILMFYLSVKLFKRKQI